MIPSFKFKNHHNWIQDFHSAAHSNWQYSLTQDTSQHLPLITSLHLLHPPPVQTADTYQQSVGQTHPELVSSQVKMKVSHTQTEGGEVREGPCWRVRGGLR